VPGMKSGLSATNSLVTAAFRSALLHQGIIALLIFTVLALAWVSIREWIPATRTASLARPRTPEPTGRMVLRVGFGIIWIFDGILQAQPAMPLGMQSEGIEPTAAASPTWVQHIVNWGGTAWSYHPIQDAAAAVWIQVGIGVWLLAGARGPWSRLAGLASVGWGLIVWVFGEAFGGIFAPGLTWLFGAPGAVLFYCAAGALIALPDRAWLTPQLGRRVLAVMGAFFLGMAVLQAWPGRGFWQGTSHGRPGTLTSMIQSMTTTPQPHLIAFWVSSFGAFVAGHGFAVNLFAVIALAAAGALLLSGQPRLLGPTVVFVAVLCLADWVLIEDLGFFGGVGTDPNSMIPMSLVVIGGYLAMTRLPAAVTEPAAAGAAAAGRAPAVTPAETATAAAVAPAAAATAAAATPAGGGQKSAAEGAGAGDAGTPTGGTRAGPDAPADTPAGAEPPGTAIPETGAPGTGAPGPGWRDRLRPSRLAREYGAASTAVVVALWAVAVILIGVAPMAMAQANSNADPIIAEAIGGTAPPLHYKAPAFTLTDQQGKTVSLASLRGKVVLLTFLDPVCTNDCPLIAQEFREADQVLGANARHVELIAVVTNPLYRAIAYTRAFDAQERMNTLPNWLYLTGSVTQLEQTWRNYGVAAEILPAGAMIAHSDITYVIDARGEVRQELDSDPGPGTQVTKASFAGLLASAAEKVMQ
jgi:cytochrome oxidase Cu insertion factor (SCO1/SenC/PrrC family)